MTKYCIEINIGFVWFAQMREVLESYAWEDNSFKWKEGNGWLDRTFYIKSSCYDDIRDLRERFYGWSTPIRRVR